MVTNELTQEELNTLSTYNAEVMRGIEHTEIWKRQMAGFQQRFDATYAKLQNEAGILTLELQKKFTNKPENLPGQPW